MFQATIKDGCRLYNKVVFDMSALQRSFIDLEVAGRTWPVTLKRYSGGVDLDEGWDRFCTDLHLSCRFCCIFTYKGNLCFQGTVFTSHQPVPSGIDIVINDLVTLLGVAIYRYPAYHEPPSHPNGIHTHLPPVEVVSEPMLDLVGGPLTPTVLCSGEIMNHGYVPVTVDQLQFLPSCACTMHTYVGVSTHYTSLISFYHHSIYTAYCIVLVCSCL